MKDTFRIPKDKSRDYFWALNCEEHLETLHTHYWIPACRNHTVSPPPQQCKVDGHSMSVLRISEMQSCAGRFLGPHASDNAIQIGNVDTADGPHHHAAECHDALMPIQMGQYCMQHTMAATQSPSQAAATQSNSLISFCNTKP